MKTPPRIRFYLVHMETGQRYPVLNEDVVIGRSSGDILFGDDMKLSSQHCRIVMMPEGLGIHDLNSANGTVVDGVRLTNEKVYAFRVGSVVEVGQQAFKLTEQTFKKRKPRRSQRSRRQQEEDVSASAMFWLAVLALIAAAVVVPSLIHHRREVVAPPPQALQSPYDIVDKEFQAVVDQYKQMGGDVQAGKLNDKDLAEKIRHELLPAFSLVKSRLWAIRPSGELERRQLDLNRRISDAVIGQITAMADQADYHDEKSSLLLKKYSADLEKLSGESQALKKQRQPAQQQ